MEEECRYCMKELCKKCLLDNRELFQKFKDYLFRCDGDKGISVNWQFFWQITHNPAFINPIITEKELTTRFKVQNHRELLNQAIEILLYLRFFSFEKSGWIVTDGCYIYNPRYNPRHPEKAGGQQETRKFVFFVNQGDAEEFKSFYPFSSFLYVCRIDEFLTRNQKLKKNNF